MTDLEIEVMRKTPPGRHFCIYVWMYLKTIDDNKGRRGEVMRQKLGVGINKMAATYTWLRKSNLLDQKQIHERGAIRGYEIIVFDGSNYVPYDKD